MNNICFNERQNIWTTKYDWAPTLSENINGVFYSIEGLGLDDKIEDGIWTHSILPDNYTINNEAQEINLNQPVKPTNWFGEQHAFEFEFVVTEPTGVHKIFDNLRIISNNVQPSEMEITVVGDSYEFKRKPVTLNETRAIRNEVSDSNPENVTTTSNIHGNDENGANKTDPHGVYHWDRRLNQSVLTKWQPFKDIYEYGRRIGNIQYKEDSWFAQIEPILLDDIKEARIRDKWAKIRIRYTGKDLAVITAILTMINI